jgi:hypothetical protein
MLTGAPVPDVASANITPDPAGISYDDERLFIETLRTGRVHVRELSPHMPWIIYRNMSDEDLKSVFAYLQTFKPSSHHVDNIEPPAYCARCGATHGLGDMNTEKPSSDAPH